MTEKQMPRDLEHHLEHNRIARKIFSANKIYFFKQYQNGFAVRGASRMRMRMRMGIRMRMIV